MKLFKKKASSCCNANFDQKSMQQALKKQEEGAKIKVLGTGCAKCIALEKSVRDALDEMGSSEAIDHITDFTEIASYGIMSTPALVVNGMVISYGKVLNKDEVINLLNKVGI